MKNFAPGVILIISLLSCDDIEKYGKSSIITFNLKDNSRISEIKLSELGFSEIEYIPLESNDNCMIPAIDAMVLNWGGCRVIIIGDNILIKNWNTILKFKDDGTFISKKIGRAHV